MNNMTSIYNIQIQLDGDWKTGFCGRLKCSLGEMLIALSEAMPGRKLRIFIQPSGVTKIAVY